MRSLRALGAIPIFLLATILLVVAAVLCLTILLLPLGVALGFFAMRLYAKGVKMLLPRRSTSKRRRPHDMAHRRHRPARRIKRVRKDTRKRIRRARRTLHV